MQINELKSELARKGITIEQLAKMTKISRTALFNKIYGKTEFKVSEILAIKRVLDLSTERCNAIFFE
jgi:transcriptional regulator with XRE-family HTH domain